ncbi:3-deoxy-D-manno-octulosonic acid transferase [Marinomonas sp. C2222]|uniref:3-deoxy-D-manno-octulosonic acid transferase n=1 Tax=Marinomonas sargassi TaxID=2984494 RepID=A0ABT2YNU3_9GAMM|nr:3-deoxy-D-manno-octulosonic acid transferase [Marinomonas sargassi]MCV2401420.1 3-deoxy-D-manno-octulosonic acid transferase [Marinomonas sargassi]
MKEAFGFWPEQQADIWIHCASVGEVLAVRPLLDEWRRKYPQHAVLITTMTPTGAEQATKLFPFADHKYLPLDYTLCLRIALKRLQCKHLLIVETELWPNLLKQAKLHGLRVDIINARLSERSFLRYQKISTLSSTLFLLPNHFFSHAEADANRIKQLGAKDVSVTGNIKFDLSVPQAVLVDDWRQQLGGRFVWIGASTHEGEDEVLLRAHAALLKNKPDSLLILVPRHPERFSSVFDLAKKEFNSVALRSETPLEEWQNLQVVVGDSMGEMMHYYQASDVAFVGGSLIERGGHNPIEPALLARPVLVGAHTFNFLDITNQLIEAGGAIRCSDELNLITQLEILARDKSVQDETGTAAQEFALRNQGAVSRVIDQIDFH